MARKIPSTMVSQHPDHAGTPYWHSEPYIATQHETQECFLSFSELGVAEYKWDWEGKFVDEAVIERLFSEHFDYFKEHALGREKFLTFRLPNPKVETEFRLGRAFMGILSAAALAREIGTHTPPVFEVILPMTETAAEMIAVQESFAEIASLKHPLYNFGANGIKHIAIIPLFEQVDVIMSSAGILEEYLALHRKKFGFTPPYLRPYLARSDPALNSGLVPTVLAIKIALSHYRELARRTGVVLHPIIGSASLPFRGGLTPRTVPTFCREYAGIRTALLQSAFRYDYDQSEVLDGIQTLDRLLPEGESQSISPADEQALRKIIPLFETNYRSTIEGIAPIINEVATQLPKRRERVQHIGLFGYSRSVGTVSLPRAIGFTGALYSLGIPPEIIGTGRGLRQAQAAGTMPLIEKYYLGIREELGRAARFVYKEGIEQQAKTSDAWQQIREDVQTIEAYLGTPLGPVTSEEVEHATLVATLHERMNKREPIADLLERLAVLRRSLG